MTSQKNNSDHYKKLILAKLSRELPAGTAIHPEFQQRFNNHFPTIFENYHDLYAGDLHFEDHLQELVQMMYCSWQERENWLKELDLMRLTDPNWFQDNQMLGGVCYVDLYAKNLNGIRQKIPYFKEIGLSYLHLMPFFRTPPGDSDGGYAVSSYRELKPGIGTVDDLKALSRELKNHNISLVADFVINHTSEQHTWALLAREGDEKFARFYYMFPDRSKPDDYEKTLREIFPSERQGSFTYYPDISKWVWTTFHSYQWDLNYSNPEVFNAMAGEMLFLANCGFEILRLDAIAFIWKEMGTSCENLPQAHQIIRALNAICRIAAPSLIFKSEAIVHPDEVQKYIRPDECHLSYNPLLMALLWTCLAAQEVRLLNISMQKRFSIHPDCAWVNYIRCHDDIGWTFDDADAQDLHIHPFYHRQWLNEFYSGRFSGSFASGLLFQENLKTGDARISGTAASLAGLEKALAEKDETLIEFAIRRILLLHGIILTIGGIPLVYLGDEIGQLNDYTFLNDSQKANDSRWVHRPKMDWKKLDSRYSEKTVRGRIFRGLIKRIKIRKENLVFTGGRMEVIQTKNDHIFAFSREYKRERCVVLSNFSYSDQVLPAPLFANLGFMDEITELISETRFSTAHEYVMRPYEQIIIA